MSVPIVETAFRGLPDNASAQWWDRETDCTLVVSTPWAEPELWDEFIEGALCSYRKHGVEQAVVIGQVHSFRLQQTQNDESPPLFVFRKPNAVRGL